MSTFDYESGSALNLTRSDADGNFYDPDAGIDPSLRIHEAILSAREAGTWQFAETFSTPDETGKLPPGFFHVQMGPVAHLIYVRVTLEAEQETGPGPMPGILIDQARIYGAQPHVVRVHFAREDDRIRIEYFGHEELEHELKSSEWWRRKLSHGRTARDCLRLVGGCKSRLEVSVKQTLAGTPLPPVQETPEELLLRAMFKEEPPMTATHDAIELALSVDPDPRTSLGGFISITALLESTHLNGESYIFTCSCGYPECTGIDAGVNVIHEDGLVVWRMRGSHPRRLLVFDQEQYRLEILTKVRQALDLHRTMKPDAELGASERPEWVAEKLARAANHAA